MTILTKAALDKALPQIAPGQTSQLINTLHQIVQSDLGQDRQKSHSDDGLDLGVCYIAHNKQNITFSGARLSLIW